MLTFHNDKKIKEKYVARVQAHQKADEVIKGKYWEDGKGCAVGCTIHGSDHERYETELGIPKEIAYLEDAMFESMPNKDAMKWPLRFIKAVHVGVDLSKVVVQFVIWQFEDKKYGLKNLKEVKNDKELYKFCEEVVALHKRTLSQEVSKEEFLELYNKINSAKNKARIIARTWAEAWAGVEARTWADGVWSWAWARAGAWAGVEAEADFQNNILISANKLLELIKTTK